MRIWLTRIYRLEAGLGIILSLLVLGLDHPYKRLDSGRVAGHVAVEGPVAIYLTGRGTEPRAGVRADVRQTNKAFAPAAISVSLGARLAFPNDDTMIHNVYSPSGALGFTDMGIAQHTKSDESNLITHEVGTVGVVHLACAIHPAMKGLVFVVPSRYHQVSIDGDYAFDEVPAGTYQVLMMGEDGEVTVLRSVDLL